jgi:hypothetical protein
MEFFALIFSYVQLTLFVQAASGHGPAQAACVAHDVTPVSCAALVF